MKISIHPGIKGKPSKDSGINLGYGWITEDLQWEDIFELITVDGYATSCALSSENRRDTNFVSRQLLMIDIDAGMTIQELLADNFYNNWAAGFYVTPSHSDDNHRFRIIFITEDPVTDVHLLRKINRALIQIFNQADQACKDAARLFYGTPDCIIKERLNNILSADMIEQLVRLQDARDAEDMVRHASSDVVYQELTDSRRARIVELLHKTYVGNYPIWRNVGWGMKAGGFTLNDFQYVTTGMMNQKSANDAAQVWRAGRADGEVTMGSVIHLLKQHHGKECLQITDDERLKELEVKMENKVSYIKELMKQWRD